MASEEEKGTGKHPPKSTEEAHPQHRAQRGGSSGAEHRGEGSEPEQGAAPGRGESGKSETGRASSGGESARAKSQKGEPRRGESK